MFRLLMNITSKPDYHILLTIQIYCLKQLKNSY